MTVNPPLGLAALSASAVGTIVYRTGSPGGMRQFVWVDRAGKELGKVGEPVGISLSPALSPNGREVALHRSVGSNMDIWLLETSRGTLRRFTTAASGEAHPAWSADGSQLTFMSGGDVYQMPLAGGTQQRLLETPEVDFPYDWSFDGRFLLYGTNEPNPSRDIWALPTFGDRKAFPVVRSRFDERDGQFSPNGKWVAYTSDESGRPEVYTQPFPGSAGGVPISTSGGGMARWRRDGRELFYVALDNRLMSVSIRQSPTGRVIEAAAPVPLFMTRLGGPLQANSRQQYMVSADGQRLLMNSLAEENAAPVTVILNWTAKP